jgi:hypothetical protein
MTRTLIGFAVGLFYCVQNSSYLQPAGLVVVEFTFRQVDSNAADAAVRGRRSRGADTEKDQTRPTSLRPF